MLVVAILALGVAGNTIIFALVNALYLRPLPFPAPGRLVDLDETAPKWNLKFTGIRYADFEEWQKQNLTFAGMAVWQHASFNLSSDDYVDRVSALRVSHDLCAVFGLKPVLGRDFGPEDDRPGAARVAILGYHTWKTRFGADAGVVGRTVVLNSQPYAIIGVLPPEGVFPTRAALWVPLVGRPEGWSFQGAGRLKAGVSVAQARSDLARLHAGLVASQRANPATSPTVMPLRDRYLGEHRIVAWVLEGSVLVVLLIACANVAGLMLARSLSRSGELGIRVALGATRVQLLRLLLAESAWLALLGGAAGVLLGIWLLHGSLAWIIEQLPPWVTVTYDLRFALFMLALLVLVATIAALVPAQQLFRHLDLRSVLAGGSRQITAGGGRARVLRGLVVAEIALALLLLVSAGLLGQAYLQLQQTNLGFATEQVLRYDIGLPGSKYPDHQSCTAFFEHHLEQLRAHPGVASASACTAIPLSGSHWGNFFEPEGAPPPAPGEQTPVILQRFAFPDYFETMSIALVSGRSFTEQDGRNEASLVAIVNETLARHFWPGQTAVGKRIRPQGSTGPWMEVIGVAQDIKHYGVDVPMRPGLYMPYRQGPQPGMTIVVRARGETATLAPAIRALLRQQDPTLLISSLASMKTVVRDSLSLRRIYSGLLAVFALVALILATAGVYGTISYVVGQRTRDVGIRLALGAQKFQIVRALLREGVLLGAIGIVLGLLSSVLAGGLLRRLMAGMNPLSPTVYVTFALLLAAVVLVACLVPAVRATRLNVMDVLRSE